MTNCEFCKKLMVGEDLSFCKNCGEFTTKGGSRWFMVGSGADPSYQVDDPTLFTKVL